MKRFLGLMLTLAMALSLIITTASAATELPFKDVTSGWYYDAVASVYEAGAMKGKAPDMFEPFSNMTRAEFVQLLANLSGVDTAEYAGEAPFKDVKPTKWYAGPIGWAYKYELVGGYPDNTFHPDQAVSREELAKLVVTYIDYADIFVPENPAIDRFNDADSIQSWARSFVESLRVTGLMAGDDYGNFNPQKTANRAEVATLTMRLLPYMSSEDVNLDLVLGRFEDGVCSAHHYYEFYMGYNGSFTAENLEAAFLAKMGLDLPEYEDRYHIVFEDSCVSDALEKYQGCGVGASIVATLVFKITDSVDNYETDDLELEYRIIKYPDAEGQFNLCPEDYDLNLIAEDLQFLVQVDDAERLFIQLQTASTFTPKNIGAYLFRQLGLAPGAFELVFEYIEDYEDMLNDYEGITHAQAILGENCSIAIRDLAETERLRENGELGEDEYVQSDFVMQSFHCEKDLSEFFNSMLPDNGTEFVFDGTLGNEASFANWLLEQVSASEGEPQHSKIRLENFEEVKNAYDAIVAGSSANIDVTATFIIPKETFIDNNKHNYPDVECERTYSIQFTK